MRYNHEGDNAMPRTTIIVSMTVADALVRCAVGTTGALDISYTFPQGPKS
jgi:hypothetical protein